MYISYSLKHAEETVENLLGKEPLTPPIATESLFFYQTGDHLILTYDEEKLALLSVPSSYQNWNGTYASSLQRHCLVPPKGMVITFTQETV